MNGAPGFSTRATSANISIGRVRYCTETVITAPSNSASANGSRGFAIDIVNDNLGERRIVFHLGAIQPEADHARRPDVRRKMRSPTAHQIEDRAALRQQLRVDLADLGDRAVVDMRDEARDRVKYLVIGVIDAAEEIGGKLLGHAEILF